VDPGFRRDDEFLYASFIYFGPLNTRRVFFQHRCRPPWTRDQFTLAAWAIQQLHRAGCTKGAFKRAKKRRVIWSDISIAAHAVRFEQ
jgi:hypothetical protein